jgi:Pentapeptide repeats (8 copies)
MAMATERPEHASSEAVQERAPIPPASRDTPSPGRVDYRGADIRGMNMSHLDLPYADFRGSDCRGVNFSYSNLPYSDWRGAKVDGANFQYTILYGAKMQGIEADGTDFRHSDMRLSNMAGAYYVNTASLPQERQSSPGELNEGHGIEETSWKERETGQDKAAKPDGNEVKSQNGQPRGRGR